MFSDFLYVLKDKGLNVSMTEWVTFMDALDRDLAESSLDVLYYLGRMILVKTESDFDKYDLAFMEYFKNIKHDDEVPENIMKFLDKKGMKPDEQNIAMYGYDQKRDMNETKRMFRERIKHRLHGRGFGIGKYGGGKSHLRGMKRFNERCEIRGSFDKDYIRICAVKEFLHIIRADR